MRKATKVLLGTFFAGALVCGIGCGVAFAEFTSLEYTGVHTYGAEDFVQEQVTYEVASSEGRVLFDDLYMGAESWSFSYDDSVPANTLVFDIAYDPSFSSCEIGSADLAVYEEYYAGVSEGEYGEVVRMFFESYRPGVYDFFEVKDSFLEELREGKFGDYVYAGATVDIRASSTLEGRIDFLSTVAWG